VTVKAPALPTTFAQLDLPEELLRVTSELGLTTLTPIQAQSLPILLQGADLVGQSRTGSGKTAAFALPLLARLRLPGRRLQALVLCPTRELCTQVARELRKLGRRSAGLQVLVVSGGQPSGPQRAALEKGVHAVVGTPGRVRDLLERGHLDLSALATVVLDEADRMLDMGFDDDMQAILGAAPVRRQTVFFSATFPDSIEALSRAYQRQPHRVTIEDDATVAPATIRQALVQSPRDAKLDALGAVLRAVAPGSALVFCNHKAAASELSDALAGSGFSAAALHGGLDQVDRDRVMAKLRNRSIRVLVATDVAARGLDVESLDLVVNYDLPAQPAVYVHRIGRTGRAGRSGIAVSLVTPSDEHRIDAIEAVLGATLERHRLADVGAAALDWRSQDAAPAADARMTAEAPSIRTALPPEMVTLYISGGRKEKVRPGDILGALTGDAAGLTADQVGRIEIHDHFAYVAVAKQVADAALQGLRHGRIKGRKFQVELVR
jgi:ATP-independent RNA helicase DbpA